MDRIIENLQLLGPVFAFFWILTIGFTVWKPQRFFNSILLLLTLAVSMLFISGFLKDDAHAYFLLGCFLLAMIIIFLIPALLIANGIQMIRRESVSIAHLLSLLLGIGIGIGEIATIVYVFNLSGIVDIGKMDRWVVLCSTSALW